MVLVGPLAAFTRSGDNCARGFGSLVKGNFHDDKASIGAVQRVALGVIVL